MTLPVIRINSSWADILGASPDVMSADDRRKRWNVWKSVAAVKSPDALEWWTDADGCDGCIHRDDDWCKLASLPVTMNPVLTLRHGTIGMACAGAGRTLQQPELFEDSGIPF